MLIRRILGTSCAVVLCALFFSAGPRRTVCAGFLPPNDMKIPIGIKGVGGLSEAQYNAVMDRMQEVYGPIVEAQGGVLQINRLWKDSTVNSSAQRQGNTYVLNMYGGLARHPAMTQDGETLVACHEMSHHLGGAPKTSDGWWATNEGQADYAAALKCMRRVFSSAGSSQFTRMSSDNDVARKACAAFKGKGEQAICLRTVTAGLSVTALFKALHHETVDPHFDTPDPAVVQETDNDHPATQCRLDTYFQGARCTQPVSTELSDDDPARGTCTRSQGYEVGLRPLCWYKPTPAEEAGQLLSRASVAPQLRESVGKSPSLSALQGSGVWQGL